MNHTSYLVQVPGQPGHFIRYDQHSPRSAEIVASPLHASHYWTENDARQMVGYGDFFLKPHQRTVGESGIQETRGAHIIRLTLNEQPPGGEGIWRLDDLGP